jgi:hypothetical protein
MQFLKLDISNGCCTSQANNDATILEWCIIDKDALFKKLYDELEFERYVSSYSPKLLETINNSLLQNGKVRNRGCDNCGIIYLFQTLDKELVKFSIRPDDVVKIEDIIYLALESRPSTAKELDEKYDVPYWFDPSIMPEYATKNGKRIIHPTKYNSVSEDSKYIYSYEKCNNYYILTKFLDGNFNKSITREQIHILLSIKISDYDWVSKEEFDEYEHGDINFESDELLFQKYNNTFDYVKANYKLPDWFNYLDNPKEYAEWLLNTPSKNGIPIRKREVKNTIRSKELVELTYLLFTYLEYLNSDRSNKVLTKNIDKLLTIKISDFDWCSKWEVPNKDSNELLFQKIDDNEEVYI